jgi:hypothetical protein|tara:strand:+ start:505 stop:693 length:189 start_codon:yes stop_codon:yes gene_type:complete
MKKNTEPQFKFSKFMKDIEKRESEGREKLVEYLDGLDELPQRKYNRLYREKWQNSTRYGRKK